MIATTLRQPTRVTLAVVVILSLSPVAARAADASPWDADSRAGMRLIAGNQAHAHGSAFLGSVRRMNPATGTPIWGSVSGDRLPPWSVIWHLGG